MAHLLEQVYVDEVDFVDILTPYRVINLVFTESVHRQIQHLEEHNSGVKMIETDGNL